MPTVNRGTVFSLFSGVSVLEDFADRLSHVWTFWLLLILASAISWKQQSFNNPIQCRVPEQFSDAHVQYAHAACWGSYQHVEFDLVQSDPVYSRRATVWIYKWLPLILCLQALLFKLPNIAMHLLHGYSGVSFEKIAGLTAGYENLNLMERTYLGKQTGRYVYNWCKQCKNCLPTRFLSIVWLLVKIMFCANAVTQLALVDKLVSTRNPPFDNSTSYGDVIYSNLFNRSATEWRQSPVFPRRINCFYPERQLKQIHWYTVQCDLPINEFNEYIYMGLWLWFLVVAVVSCLSLLVWLARKLVPFGRERYISRMLDLSYELNSNQLKRSDVIRLVDMVGEDGVTVLKLIASNSSELLVRDAVTSMFQMKQIQQQPYFMNGPEVTSNPAEPAPAHPFAH